MSKRLFIKSVGNIDDELLIRYDEIENHLAQKPRRKRLIVRISAIAACFCLIIGSVLGAMYFTGDETPGDQSDSTEYDQFGRLIYDQPVWLSPLTKNSGGSIGGVSGEPQPPYVLFDRGMSAIGRVKSVLPDTYARAGASSVEWRYRIIVVEVFESVYGKDLPNEMLIMIPSYLDASALLNYERVLFAFRQKGFENYVLINETKKRAEAFSMMFETPGFDNFCFAPFTNGIFDISLWQCKGWKNHFYKEEYMLDFFSNRDQFPIMRGDTLEQAKENVRYLISQSYRKPLDRVLTSDVFSFPEAQEVIAHCKPFENGLYSQGAFVNNGSTVFFERFLYGFSTNEMIRISETDNNVTYYGEKFTDNELATLPNIATFFENTDISSMSPAHTDIPIGATVSDPMLSGKYIKKSGQVYCVARVAWRITPEHKEFYYLDDSYFLIAEDGKHKLIDREELRTLTGDDEFITVFEYGNPIYPIVE